MMLRTALIGMLVLGSACTEASGLFEESLVFSGLYNGISGSNYRIPSIVSASNGNLIAFSEGRASGSDPGSTAGLNRIVWRVSTDKGHSWSAQYTFGSSGVGDCSNPVSLLDPTTGNVFLFYNKWPSGKGQMSVGNGTGTDSCTVWMRKSTDNGLTWSIETNLTSNVKNSAWAASVVGPGNGIATQFSHQGRLIVPALRNTSSDRNSDPYTIYSDDHGLSWSYGAVANASYHADENNVVELTDSSLMLNVRTNSNWRAKFLDKDYGASWEGPTTFLNGITPVCTATVRYSAKRNGSGVDRVLFSAPAGTSAGPSRNNMSVWISYDEGLSFTNSTLIHPGSSAYSSMTVLPDGTVGLLYEADNYGSIRFARFDLAYLGDKVVPEPATWLGLGTFTLLAMRKRK